MIRCKSYPKCVFFPPCVGSAFLSCTTYQGCRIVSKHRSVAIWCTKCWRQKWSHHTIGMFLFSGQSRFRAPFYSHGQSALNRDTAVKIPFSQPRSGMAFGYFILGLARRRLSVRSLYLGLCWREDGCFLAFC